MISSVRVQRLKSLDQLAQDRFGKSRTPITSSNALAIAEVRALVDGDAPTASSQDKASG